MIISKKLLKELLWGSQPLRERYDKFLREVKYMGTAQITEIMCSSSPRNYAIWNRRVMNYLGFNDILPVNKHFPSGKEYERIVKAMKEGTSLGFDADKEASIARGARVDVVWSAKIGNLGIMKYIFEVHLKGSIDSLILNLQKAKKNPQVQKVVVVSTPSQIEKIREEIREVSEDFAKQYLI